MFFLDHIFKFKLSDTKLITINLGFEHNVFRSGLDHQESGTFSGFYCKVKQVVYNCQKRNLFSHVKKIKTFLSGSSLVRLDLKFLCRKINEGTSNQILPFHKSQKTTENAFLQLHEQIMIFIKYMKKMMSSEKTGCFHNKLNCPFMINK
jgi:hypothetical protein